MGCVVSDPLIDADDDASTPLTAEERDALIPRYITRRHELNEVEQIGIADADRWAFVRRRDVLSEEFLCHLHKRTFGDVWKWAGGFSKETKRRIGADHWQIGVQLQQFLGDVRSLVGLNIRPSPLMKSRCASITGSSSFTPFPNGNGRLSRLAADLLIVQLGGERFSWGSGNLIAIVDLRRRLYRRATRGGS
jgi:Fic-DOC domain mobile mystery protein B